MAISRLLITSAMLGVGLGLNLDACDV